MLAWKLEIIGRSIEVVRLGELGLHLLKQRFCCRLADFPSTSFFLGHLLPKST